MALHKRPDGQSRGDLGTEFETKRHDPLDRAKYLIRNLEQAVERGVDDVQKRWEESDYDAESTLHRLRGQALIWLFSMGRRVRQSNIPLSTYFKPLGIVFAGLLIARLIPTGALLILTGGVLISVRAGGLRAGLLSTLLSFFVVLFVVRGALHTGAGPGILFMLLCFLIVSTLGCFLIDSLKIARQDAHRERREAEAVAHRSRFLAEASAMLETEYTAESMLAAVVRACVPAFAQWAVADLVVDGSLRRTALYHQDDGIAALLRSSQRGRSLFLPPGSTLREALNSQQPCIFENVSEEALGPLRLDHQDARGLKPIHLLFIPLTARQRLLGVLSLVSTDAERSFSPTDLAAARDLGRRVGMALDNLRLYCGVVDEAADLARRARIVSDQKLLLEMERSSLVAQNAILSVEATTDGLTGLLNHGTFQRELEAQFQRAQREGAALSVAMLDVDRFKPYNDAYGHPAGDEVLKQLARILQLSSRSTDMVARYGGEEFIVVMPDTDSRQSLEAMERVRQAVASASWPRRPITASLGIASIRPGIRTRHELIAAADNALYRSKQQGRNRLTHADGLAEAIVFHTGAHPLLEAHTD